MDQIRIRGLRTNIPFLNNLILHETFRKGIATTRFIDETPELFRWPARRDRATRLLNFVGDVVVNGNPEVKGRTDLRELREPVAPFPPLGAPPAGTSS